MPRMQILPKKEMKAYDRPPFLSNSNRKHFFNFPVELLQKAGRIRKHSNRIGFLLAAGYFKRTNKFFLPHEYRPRDIDYIARKLGLSSQDFEPQQFSKGTLHRYRRSILKYYGFQEFDNNIELLLKKEISLMAKKHLKPVFIFWRSAEFLRSKKIEAISYRQMSALIIQTIKKEREILNELLQRQMDDTQRNILESLFLQQHRAQPSKHSPYQITLLKKVSQSVKPSKVKKKVDDLLYCRELYESVGPLLSNLGLENEGIRYYANSVIKSEVFQISRRKDEDRYLHLIAFISHQYYQIQDNLVDVFLSVMKSFDNASSRDHRDWCYATQREYRRSIQSYLTILDDNFSELMQGIEAVMENAELSDKEKLKRIGKIVRKQSAKPIQGKEIRNSLIDENMSNSYYDILEKRSLRLQKRVNPILRHLEFQYTNVNLMRALQHFQEKEGSITQSAPLEFLEPPQREAIFKGGTFRPSLYKALLFLHLADAMKAGTLNLIQSYKYRPLDTYLIEKEIWEADKKRFIRAAGLEEFVCLNPLLDNLSASLNERYKLTNENYLNSLNPYLTMHTKGHFVISTPAQEEEEEEKTLLQSYFPDNRFVPLMEILSTVNEHCGFLEEFQHWQTKYSKNTADFKTIIAGIMGKGCAIGSEELARISNQINPHNLSHVINWYFSLENIRSAIDRILQLMKKMELLQIYRKSKDILHTASDGQKFTVRAESLNSGYSFKYFGQEEGSSAYTFIDERGLMWHSLVFSASERESAYVIDGLERNNVVKSDIHSTDTHGYSEIIFAVSHMLGFSYAPRIKKLKDQTLYTFKKYKNVPDDWVIRHKKYINEASLHESWDDILRLIATIKLKKSTASDIFRRMNSYSKQHKLYTALKTFGQIIKSQFILIYG